MSDHVADIGPGGQPHGRDDLRPSAPTGLTHGELVLKPDLAAPGGKHLVDLAARAGRLHVAQRHLDGVAARRRRGRAAPPPGAPQSLGPRRCCDVLQNTRRRAIWPGDHATSLILVNPPGRGPDPHRRRRAGRGDGSRPGQALARRERGRTGDEDAHADEQWQRQRDVRPVQCRRDRDNRNLPG